MSTEKAGLPETILFKRLEGGKVEEVARWVGLVFYLLFLCKVGLVFTR